VLTPLLVLSWLVVAVMLVPAAGMAAPLAQDTPPPFEPNNSFGKAALIDLGAPVQDTIRPRGDVDWYRFTTASHGELQLRVTNVPATLDITFRVLNAERDQISDMFAPFAKGRDTQGIVDLPGPGTYYIELQDGGGDADSTQPYTLQATFTPAFDPEPNGRAAQAAPLILGEETQATILPIRDVDWFFVDVETQGELVIIVTQVPATLDVAFRVYNSNIDVLRDWFNPLTTGADNFGAVDLPAAGRYYIEVRDQGDNARSAATYTLVAEFAPSPDAAEPNDYFGGATTIEVGIPFTATILPRYDGDWFRFDVAEQGLLSMTIATVPPELDLEFRFWNANRETITDWFRASAAGEPVAGAIQVGEAGIYYAEVDDYADDSRSVAPYSLLVELSPTDDAAEPNNTFGRAYPLGEGGEYDVQATIFPQRDTDWYEVVVDNAGVLSVTLTGAPDPLDLEFRVWTANRDVTLNWVAPAAVGSDTVAAVDLGDSGRHLIEVHDRYDDAGSVLPYSLITTFDAAPDANEPNQELASSKPISLEVEVTGAIFPRGDVDWYAVTLDAPGDLAVAITSIAPELDIAARLFYPDGNGVADWLRPAAAGADTTGVIAIPAAGTYHLQVIDNNYDARSLQPYSLVVSARAQPTPEPTAEPDGAAPGAPIPDTAPPADEPTPAPAEEPTPVPTEQPASAYPGVTATVGAAGGEIAVDAAADPLAAAWLSVPPDAVPADTDFTLQAGVTAPEGELMGLFPAGYYWDLAWTVTDQSASLAVPATLYLPVPDELADTPLFVAGWDGEEWTALDSEIVDGEIAAAVDSSSLYAAFCGDLAAYREVSLANETRSREIEIALLAGPDPVDDTDTETVIGCPPPADGSVMQSVRRRSAADFLLRPGRYELGVTYLLPEPPVEAALVIIVPPGEEPITVDIAEDGATSEDPDVVIEFAGRAQ
jgi:hypothetical protein